MVLRIVLAALVCMICACAGAQAQVRGEVISAYNQAVQSGDADGTLRAATALAEAAMANPGDERAALLAFEAGWKLCEAGRCEAAIAPAEFALAQPAGEGHPGPAQRKLLLAYARWKRDQDRSTRRALDKALDPLLNAEPSMVSATAFTQRMLADMRNERGRWLNNSSEAAATHLEPVRLQFGETWAVASFLSILAPHKKRPLTKHHRKMAHLNGKLGQMRAAFEAPDTPDASQWLEDAYWRSEAWLLAMDSYYMSSFMEGLSQEELDAIAAEYPLPDIEARLPGMDPDYLSSSMDGLSPEELDAAPEGSATPSSDGTAEQEEGSDEVDRLPLCDGDFVDPPAPSFPKEMVRQGFVGAVLVGFDLVEGRIRNAEVLAAVPAEGFNKATLESMTDLKWAPAEEQPVQPCGLSRTKIVYPVQFAIGR